MNHYPFLLIPLLFLVFGLCFALFIADASYDLERWLNRRKRRKLQEARLKRLRSRLQRSW